MQSLFHFCTIFDGDLRTVGDEMIQKFNSNTGGTYSNPILANKVSSNGKFIDFVKRFGEDLNNRLRANNGNINSVANFQTATRPIFNGGFNKFNGLQILLNDTEFTEIQLDNYSIDASGNWNAEETFTIHDHFGLDKNDALKYQGYHEGFASWWLLQHTRNYTPFETIVTVRKRISSQL